MPPNAITYALVEGPERLGYLNGGSDDVSTVNALKQTIAGDFLWLRQAGRTWVVDDPVLLAPLRGRSAPLQRLMAEVVANNRILARMGNGPVPPGTPMEEASKKINALGLAMRHEREAADLLVFAVIDAARRSGVARPAGRS